MSSDRRSARDAAVPRRRRADLDNGFRREDLEDMLCDAISLRETLARVADYSLLAFPAADGVAVRLADGTARVVAGDPSTRPVDDLHDTFDEGPALDALASLDVAWCGSLGGSDRWRRFGPRGGRMGFHSVLSLPLIMSDAPIGTITLYAAAKHAFTKLDVSVAQRSAMPITALIRNAVMLEQSRRTAAQLTEALEVRPQIDRAVGLIMSRTGKSADEALQTLRAMSNARHVKVADVARDLVAEAVRRAQRRTISRPNSAASERIALNNA